ncbi:MAG: hypothetical protein FJ115_00035 [Deltaproteobacteria bacterium]|nr:hypothetical protein [Deltaproteobacteria bacterium]
MWNLKEVIHTASAEEIPLPSLDKGGIENIGSKFNLGLESTNEKFPASQGRESSFADFVFLMAPTTIAALSFVSTVPAGWGLAFLLKFLILLAIAGSSMIIGVLFFPFWIVTVLLWRLLTAIQLLCDLLVEIGGSFLRLFNFRPPSQTGTPTQVETANAPSQPAIEPSSPTPISGNGHHDEIGFNPFRRQQ